MNTWTEDLKCRFWGVWCCNKMELQVSWSNAYPCGWARGVSHYVKPHSWTNCSTHTRYCKNWIVLMCILISSFLFLCCCFFQLQVENNPSPRCLGVGTWIAPAGAPIGRSTQLHCSRKGVSNRIATPKVSMASSLLQQGNNLHQTCFLAQTAFTLCQLQCVGWHFAEMRGREERVETESWLHHSLLWPALAVQPSMGKFAFGEANPLFMAAQGWCWGSALLTPGLDRRMDLRAALLRSSPQSYLSH